MPFSKDYKYWDCQSELGLHCLTNNPKEISGLKRVNMYQEFG